MPLMPPPPAHSHGIDLCHFRQMPLFAALTDAELLALAAATHRQDCRRGDVPLPDNAATATVYVVVQGCIRLYRLAPSGQTVTLRTLHAGDPFTIRDHDQLESLRDDTLLYGLPRPAVERIVATHLPAALAACRLLHQRLSAADERLEDVKLGHTPTRLGRLLARRWQQSGGQPVQVSHQDLADLIGAQPTDVTKALRHLRERGLISYPPHRRGIIVHDAAALAAV